MSSDIAISVRNLTKTYRLFAHPGDRIKQAMTLGLRKYHKEFTALKDVSFDIKNGETVGIIGRNGSGKSTLLQLICGILKPSAGTVHVNGRISALLELGAGFNPEFTGRENVYFQGALLGFTKAEMDASFNDIAVFADIGEFIDQPVRLYSSGMYVRLAFAVGIHTNPDILIVDEALSVGDIGFQTKCLRKIDALKGNGVTVLLVSHNTEQVVQHCDRALLLNDGKLMLDGLAKNCVFAYKRLITATGQNRSNGSLQNDHSGTKGNDVGKAKMRLMRIAIEDDCDSEANTIERNKNFSISMRALINEAVDAPIFFFNITDARGETLCGTSNRAQAVNLGRLQGGSQIDVRFQQPMLLNPGKYFLSVGCQTFEDGGYQSHDLRWECITFEVISDSPRPGYFDMQSSIKWVVQQGFST